MSDTNIDKKKNYNLKMVVNIAIIISAMSVLGSGIKTVVAVWGLPEQMQDVQHRLDRIEKQLKIDPPVGFDVSTNSVVWVNL